MCMKTFGLHGSISCVSSEGVLYKLPCIQSVGIGTFDLHELILHVSEGILYKLLFIHIVGIGTFGLHEVISCVSEGHLSVLLCIHNVCI